VKPGSICFFHFSESANHGHWNAIPAPYTLREYYQHQEYSHGKIEIVKVPFEEYWIFIGNAALDQTISTVPFMLMMSNGQIVTVYGVSRHNHITVVCNALW
jgi:hypothetical protein